MALGLLFNGIDHFASAHTRYLPMIPDALAPVGLELVYVSGLAELAAAVVLLVPARVFTTIGWRNAHRAAGIALAALFSLLVVANINVAVKGGAGFTASTSATHISLSGRCFSHCSSCGLCIAAE